MTIRALVYVIPMKFSHGNYHMAKCADGVWYERYEHKDGTRTAWRPVPEACVTPDICPEVFTKTDMTARLPKLSYKD